MPKTKFEDAIYTIIMATIMVYGMIVYNVALNTGGVSGQTFLLATHEMIIMVPVAFVLEFFIVGKIAQKLAFTVMKPTDRPQFITYAISICICCIMCPIMSLVATILFKDQHTFGTWIQTWAMNFPMAICWQMFYCGPLVRLIFRTNFLQEVTSSPTYRGGGFPNLGGFGSRSIVQCAKHKRANPVCPTVSILLSFCHAITNRIPSFLILIAAFTSLS